MLRLSSTLCERLGTMTNDAILGFASLAVLAISAWLWLRAIERVEIPENRGLFISAWLVAALLGFVALMGEPGWLGGVPAGLGLFASAFFLATVVVGAQKVAPGVVQVGDPIPAFTALDEHGETFDSASLAGHPVLIKFFRGHW